MAVLLVRGGTLACGRGGGKVPIHTTVALWYGTLYMHMYFVYKMLCCGSGIRCFFDPWIRIRDPEKIFSESWITDPGYRFHPHELSNNFLGYKYLDSFVSWLKSFSLHYRYLFKILSAFRFCEICGYKKIRQLSFLPSSFCYCWIRDPGSRFGIRDGKNQDPR